MTTHDEIEGVIKTLEEEGDYFSRDVSILLRRLRDERDQARAELEKARQALEPFANAASNLEPSDKGHWSLVDLPEAGEAVVADHLRIAARVHAETGG